MFTGLIQEIGEVVAIESNQTGKKLTIAGPTICEHLALGDSVAVNGACQTVIHKSGHSFSVQAVHVTLDKTTLGSLTRSDQVNLELSLRLGDRLGGHLVQGHVNGVGKIIQVNPRGENREVWIEVPSALTKYLVKEGSIAIDGTSLTIADLNESAVCVSLVPHTWTHTIFQYKKILSPVNIEVDVMAKYVEKLLAPYAKHSSLTMDQLRSLGF